MIDVLLRVNLIFISRSNSLLFFSGCDQPEDEMEVGVASYSQSRPVARSSPDPSSRGSPRANLHVEFAQVGEMKERKEKYLTAKYGAHQMSLIRKRLGVEMWMYDRLQNLYQSSKVSYVGVRGPLKLYGHFPVI